MQLFIDDQPMTGPELDDGTLEDALRHVQSAVTKSARIVVGVRCDGEVISGVPMATTLKRPVSSFDRVDVITSTRALLVTEAMTHASQSLEESETATQEAAKLLVEGKTVEATQLLGECLRVWQQIHEAVSKSLSILEMDPERVTLKDERLIDAISRPKEVLLQVRDALTARDYVLLADVLQYEFADVTQTWHTLIARIRQEAEDRRAA